MPGEPCKPCSLPRRDPQPLVGAPIYPPIRVQRTAAGHWLRPSSAHSLRHAPTRLHAQRSQAAKPAIVGIQPLSTLGLLNLVFLEPTACPALYSTWIGISWDGRLGPSFSCGTLDAASSSKSPRVTLQRCRRRWTTSCAVCARSTRMAMRRMRLHKPRASTNPSCGLAQLKISIGSHTAKLAATANAPITPQHHQSSSSFFSMPTPNLVLSAPSRERM